MTTNREWLYSLDPLDLSDWFDAEHVDTCPNATPWAATKWFWGKKRRGY